MPDLSAPQSSFEALMAAISDENLAGIKAALEAGADVNARDEEGNTPLVNASNTENPDCVKMILEAGADVEARDRWDGTPMINLVQFGSEENGGIEMTRLFIEAQANLNAVDEDGMTALMYAARDGMENIARLLIDNGADIEIKDNEGKTAQDWAALNERSGEKILAVIKEASEARQAALQQKALRQEAYIKSTHQTAAQRQAVLKKRISGITLKA